MDFFRAARCCSIGAVALLAASCTTTTSGTTPAATSVSTGSDNDGANCGGTPINKQSCLDNQTRMND